MDAPFAVFGGDTYYADGGWNDFKSVHPTLDEAKAAALALSRDWWQIVDLSQLKIVAASDQKPY